ncbi:MFS transporter [Streptomyces sp. NPDC052496]|uniref:MFS transporter n=1 Tax=Streptomyces sp. NPDC052496 TaxID=3154951 RepID=UPI00343B4DDE
MNFGPRSRRGTHFFPTGRHSRNAKKKPDRTAPPGATTFGSLRIRNFRLFAAGQAVSNTGTWMQRIAQDWLVAQLTGSPTAVGVTVGLQYVPMLLLGLHGGLIADRLPMRRLLLRTQTVLGTTSLILAVLVLSGQVRPWHVYIMAAVLGLVAVADAPARQAFVAELVGPEQLRNAVSLNAAAFQATRLVGPAVAGVVIAVAGSGWAFLLNALSYLAPLAALLLMCPGEMHPAERAPHGSGQVRATLRQVGHDPALLWPIVLVAFIGTFGFNFPVWLTAFTVRVFHSGSGVYGLLSSLLAAGAVAGALWAARSQAPPRRVLTAAGLLFGALETAAALAPAPWLFAALLVPVGMAGLAVTTTANAHVQLTAGAATRGRVMSLFKIAFMGGTPVSAPAIGWITETHGPRAGFLTGGLTSLTAAAAVGFALSRTAMAPTETARKPASGTETRTDGDAGTAAKT